MHARARVRGAGSACIEAQYPETSALLVRCAVHTWVHLVEARVGRARSSA